ncbi:MAG TPA: hypothetical protein VLR26_16280 [Frankiaceae bacterium]|nr:hypothetical protein [Frankiaceae bacterium]
MPYSATKAGIANMVASLAQLLAPVYVLLASDEASYMSGARVAVTGDSPIL